MKVKTEIIVLRESVAQSWMIDASSLAMAVGMMGIGVWLGSEAMQWVGGFVWFFTMITLATHRAKKMTVAEARKRLDEIDGGAS